MATYEALRCEILLYLIVFRVFKRKFKEKFNGNLDEYVKDEKVNYYVQLGTGMYIELMRMS